jgi:DNA-binding CsgD family transcriptional regulator
MPPSRSSLIITPKTAGNHIEHISTKIGVSTFDLD